MLVGIHNEGRVYVIEAPAGARVVQTSGEDCLVYRWEGRTEYLLTPFAVRGERHFDPMSQPHFCGSGDRA
jgi:hypothetical protein